MSHTKPELQSFIDDAIERATRTLVDAAHPDQIVLFGSRARGDSHRHSDLDLLVILSSVKDPFEEAARLRLTLMDLPLAIDLIVMTRAEVEERAHLRGTMLYHALREGRVLYDAA